MASSRPQREINPTLKLSAAVNGEKPLPFQRKSIAAAAARRQTSSTTTPLPLSTSLTPNPNALPPAPTVNDNQPPLNTTTPGSSDPVVLSTSHLISNKHTPSNHTSDNNHIGGFMENKMDKSGEVQKKKRKQKKTGKETNRYVTIDHLKFSESFP